MIEIAVSGRQRRGFHCQFDVKTGNGICRYRQRIGTARAHAADLAPRYVRHAENPRLVAQVHKLDGATLLLVGIEHGIAERYPRRRCVAVERQRVVNTHDAQTLAR